MEKDIKVQSEEVVSYVREYDTHFIIHGFVHVRFNNKIHEMDFSKTIMK